MRLVAITVGHWFSSLPACVQFTFCDDGNKQSSMRMRAGPGKSWPRRAAPRSGCSLVPAQIRMLDCCSHMFFHLWPLRSTARCHDDGPYHFSTARCHGNRPDCTIFHAILWSKCIRDVTAVGRLWDYPFWQTQKLVWMLKFHVEQQNNCEEDTYLWSIASRAHKLTSETKMTSEYNPGQTKRPSKSWKRGIEYTLRVSQIAVMPDNSVQTVECDGQEKWCDEPRQCDARNTNSGEFRFCDTLWQPVSQLDMGPFSQYVAQGKTY